MSARNIFSLFVIIFCIATVCETYDFTWTPAKVGELLGDVTVCYNKLMSFYEYRKQNLQIKKYKKIVSDVYDSFHKDIADLQKLHKTLKSNIKKSSECPHNVTSNFKQMVKYFQAEVKYCHSKFETHVKDETHKLLSTLEIMERSMNQLTNAFLACPKYKGANYDICCRKTIRDKDIDFVLQRTIYTEQRDAYILSIGLRQEQFIKCIKNIESILANTKHQIKSCILSTSKSI